jgi:hypothetical protein
MTKAADDYRKRERNKEKERKKERKIIIKLWL